MKDKMQLPEATVKSMNRMGFVLVMIMMFIVALFLLKVISQTVFTALLVIAAIIQSIISFRVILNAKKTIQKQNDTHAKNEDF